MIEWNNLHNNIYRNKRGVQYQNKNKMSKMLQSKVVKVQAIKLSAPLGLTRLRAEFKGIPAIRRESRERMI